MNTADSFVPVTQVEEISTEEGKAFRLGDHSIALFKMDSGEIYAIENACPHIGAPLENGVINHEKCELTCLWHGWSFDLKTGASLNYQGAKVKTLPVKISQNQVFVDLSTLQ